LKSLALLLLLSLTASAQFVPTQTEVSIYGIKFFSASGEYCQVEFARIPQFGFPDAFRLVEQLNNKKMDLTCVDRKLTEIELNVPAGVSLRLTDSNGTTQISQKWSLTVKSDGTSNPLLGIKAAFDETGRPLVFTDRDLPAKSLNLPAFIESLGTKRSVISARQRSDGGWQIISETVK
jgi:hypothetical protein